MDFLSKFPFRLLYMDRNCPIDFEPAPLQAWEVVCLTLLELLNRALPCTLRGWNLAVGRLPLCSLGADCCSCLSNHGNRNKNVEAKVLVFLKTSVTMPYFCFPISSTQRGVCADGPTALCNLPKCWTGTVVYWAVLLATSDYPNGITLGILS